MDIGTTENITYLHSLMVIKSKACPKCLLVTWSSSALLRYGGTNPAQSCMSVRINRSGNTVIALRRRLPPVMYNIHETNAVCQFDHNGYYNSCTMKSCCFAGDNDQVIVFSLVVFPKLSQFAGKENTVWLSSARLGPFLNYNKTKGNFN